MRGTTEGQNGRGSIGTIILTFRTHFILKAKLISILSKLYRFSLRGQNITFPPFFFFFFFVLTDTSGGEHRYYSIGAIVY